MSGDPPPDSAGGSARSASSPEWGRPALEGVRTGRYLYVEYENGERELYDLLEDPHQLENLYAKLLSRL